MLRETPQSDAQSTQAGGVDGAAQEQQGTNAQFASHGVIPPVSGFGSTGRGAPTASERAYEQIGTTPTADGANRTQTKSTAHPGKELDDTSYMHDYHHIAGGGALDDDALTDKDGEAPVLNAIRDNQTKFDPAYLLGLQNELKVGNKSGAFNTETLRKLRGYYKANKPTQKVDAHAILDGQILTAIYAGTPFVDTGSGYGEHARGGTGTREPGVTKADGMAQAAGYANWEEMEGSMETMSLCGLKFGRGLPHLAARVRLADQWLQAQYPKPSNKDWKTHAKEKLGWNYTANGAYSANAAAIGAAQGVFIGGVAAGVHMHSSGLALDIDATHNPYVFAGDTDHEGSINDIMARHLRYAAQLYGGEQVSAQQMWRWSKEMSTEEMYAKIDEVSSSLHQYLALCNKSDAEIMAAFHDLAGFSEEEAKAVVPSVKRFGQSGYRDEINNGKRFFQDNVGRQEASGLMTHSMPMVVALRDVAGLSWGAAEFSEHGNSGDFMHFDCRNEAIGQSVLSFGHNNQVSDADHARTSAQQDPRSRQR